MISFCQDPETIYHTFIELFRGWCHEEPMNIFRRVCFCATSSSSFSCDPNRARTNSSSQQRRRRQLYLLKMQSRLMYILVQAGGTMWSVCQTCCRKLADAWDMPQVFASFPTTSTSSQAAREVLECAICFDGTSDFLFVPCGHRCVCESCADTLLRGSRSCPICRNAITGKQRVHDV
jgi:hypothetical protein